MSRISILCWCLLLSGLGQAQTTPETEIGGSVGVAVSTIVEPKFLIDKSGEHPLVIQSLHAQDERSVGVVPFAHVMRQRGSNRDYWGFSFGGTNASSDDLNLFAGFSYHLAHNFYITAGMNWKSVPTLPAEQKLNHPPLRDDILADLPTRTEKGFFIAWTYAVVGENDGVGSPTRRGLGPNHPLTLYDDNGNGRITCAEARSNDVETPVLESHPAYQYMTDADDDGMVCE